MRITALTLLTHQQTSTGAVELSYTPARPLPFRAGQGGLVLLPGGGVKPFTFSSDAHGQALSIATTLHSGSRFKAALSRLRPGDRLGAVGAVGTLPALSPDQPQVLIAQGIGITPFLSMARTHDHLQAVLLQVGTPHFFEETAASMARSEHHAHRDGLTAALRHTLVEQPQAQWSISGRPDFVAAVAAQLHQAGVPRRRVHRDTFWTMRSSAPAASNTPSAFETVNTSGGPGALTAGTRS